MKVLVAFLCGLVRSCAAYDRPATVEVGLLFPLVKESGGSQVIDGGGKRRLLGALQVHGLTYPHFPPNAVLLARALTLACFGRCFTRMALNELNNKTDGIYDTLLPNTQIEFTVRDSKRDGGPASVGVLDIITKHEDLAAVIGPASSGPSSSVAKILEIFNVAQIGYSATSAALSDASVYPFFGRVAPSDALQSQLMANFIHAQGWRAALALSGDDSYSAQGISDFVKSGGEAGIDIQASRQFVRGTTAGVVREHLLTLKATKVKLIVMFAQADDMVTVFNEAKALGMWGSDGYTWVLSEIILGNYPELIQGLGGQSEVDLAFRGAFTQAPSNGAGTAAYESLATRWAQMPNTATNGPSGGCSEDTDDFGYYLWQQDETSPGLSKDLVANASNLICAGFDPTHADDGVSQYVPQVAGYHNRTRAGGSPAPLLSFVAPPQ